MIKIIAVHPDVMSTPEGIREYLKDFGTGKGRWIPLVPTNWKSIVSQAIKRDRTLAPVKKGELRDKITNPRFGDKYLKIDQVDSDGREWAQIVREFCDLGAFDAAIVSGEMDAGEKSLKAFEFDPDSELYAVRISGFLSRDPDELADRVAPALRFAKELHVIDVFCKSRATNSVSYGRFFSQVTGHMQTDQPSVDLHYPSHQGTG